MSSLIKFLFPLTQGFSFAGEEGVVVQEEETKVEEKPDTSANIKQVQELIETARKEERIKLQKALDEANEKYENQVKRAKKVEDAAKHTTEAEEEVANLKERLRLAEEDRNVWKTKAAKSKENNINSRVTSAVSRVAQKLVDPSAESTLRMLTKPYITEGKEEQIVVLDNDGVPRLKQDDKGRIVPFTVDDLTTEILETHTYLLAATSKGGSGATSKREGITTSTIDKLKNMSDVELGEFMKNLPEEERRSIVDQF